MSGRGKGWVVDRGVVRQCRRGIVFTRDTDGSLWINFVRRYSGSGYRIRKRSVDESEA